MTRHEISNRSGMKLVIQVDETVTSDRLVFIAHGQAGFMSQPHIEAFTRAFLKNGYRVIRFDATHALGDSDGDLMDVTYDSYVSDLEDVIAWARSQDWFVEPFALCGHSMGAQSTAWYAEHHPDEVSLIAPMAPVVNYELYVATMDDEYLRDYKAKGFKEMQSRSKPGVIKRVGWGVIESLKRFDLLPLASKLSMPVFCAVGAYDQSCPAGHQRILFEAIKNPSSVLTVVADGEHDYRNHKSQEWGEELSKVESLLDGWLRQLRT